MKSNLNLILIMMLSVNFISSVAWAKKEKAATRAAASLEWTEEGQDFSLSDAQRELRLQHARELLGSHYNTSSVRAGENVAKINSRIISWTRERLPKRYKKDAKRIAQAIIDESLKHQFDPVFVMSVIQNESSFDPTRLGSLDEIGLMQLRPGTAEWIATKFDLDYRGKKTLRDPVENIRIGTAYMDYLRERFDSHAQLYLSAYNMGKRNVDKALEKNVWPKDYASHVMHYYVEFYSEIKEAQRKKISKSKLALL